MWNIVGASHRPLPLRESIERQCLRWNNDDIWSYLRRLPVSGSGRAGVLAIGRLVPTRRIGCRSKDWLTIDRRTQPNLTMRLIHSEYHTPSDTHGGKVSLAKYHSVAITRSSWYPANVYPAHFHNTELSIAHIPHICFCPAYLILANLEPTISHSICGLCCPRAS